jgi:hypothetical protein
VIVDAPCWLRLSWPADDHVRLVPGLEDLFVLAVPGVIERLHEFGIALFGGGHGWVLLSERLGACSACLATVRHVHRGAYRMSRSAAAA